MQKIATTIFIIASICFGLIGLSIIFFGNWGGPDNVEPNQTLMRLLFACVFIILPSFAVSLAGKYLNGKE